MEEQKQIVENKQVVDIIPKVDYHNDGWVIVDSYWQEKALQQIIDDIGVTDEWIIKQLKMWVEEAYKVDKNWNPVNDWGARSRMLDMLAKMKWMYKEDNTQNKAVMNVLNAFSGKGKNLL